MAMAVVAALENAVLATESELERVADFLAPLSKRAMKKAKARHRRPLEFRRQANPDLISAGASDGSAVSAVVSADAEWVPLMPTDLFVQHPHRSHVAHSLYQSAAVARPVSKQETARNPAALAAKKKEWDNVVEREVWRFSTVTEWKSVARKAREAGETVNLGRLFGIMVDKNSELPDSDPRKKFKYRVVFGGNNVIDQSYEAATFQDLGSSPSNMAAGRYLDFYSCLPDYSGQQADAQQAYIQSTYTGTETWLILPEEVWPEDWKGKYSCPVVRMDKALYGHPDSGGMWETHCEKSLKELGFEHVPDGVSVYYHRELRLLLSVYIDDYKLARPTKNLSSG